MRVFTVRHVYSRLAHHLAYSVAFISWLCSRLNETFWNTSLVQEKLESADLARLIKIAEERFAKCTYFVIR